MYRECRLLMYIFCIHFLYIDNLQNIGTVNVVSSLSDLIMLPNCLFSTAIPNCPWCQIVRFSLRCQIVRFYITVQNCPCAQLSAVQNYPRCKIVLVSNCPRIHSLGRWVTFGAKFNFPLCYPKGAHS
jgi:hypothetical protein